MHWVRMGATCNTVEGRELARRLAPGHGLAHSLDKRMLRLSASPKPAKGDKQAGLLPPGTHYGDRITGDQ